MIPQIRRGSLPEKLVFRGAGVAVITPFTETGINYPELGRIIEDQIAGGTDAIIITGTTGESATMTDAEHREAIRYTVKQVKGRIPVVAGTGSNETSYAIELSKYAEHVGADALLLVTPYYNKCTQNGLAAHYNGDCRQRQYSRNSLQCAFAHGGEHQDGDLCAARKTSAHCCGQGGER